MKTSNRILSIDIMRGLTLVLMLFVNDLYMPGVPAWLGHMKADFDGMGLADWVFPGFLFMVGMAIPFAIGGRISKGETNITISRHIAIRTISLLIIGVLMLNSGRLNAELTGMSENLWALLMYAGVFLIWNKYPETDKNFFSVTGLRLLGMALLTFLVFRFKSGQEVNDGSLITGWWGILGLIGWGYLAAGFIYLAFRDNLFYTGLSVIFFLVLNILSGLNLLDFLNPVKFLFGTIIDGNVPFIVLSGLFTTLILKKLSASDHKKLILTIVTFGLISLAAGFILRKWFIISKIQATPSWGLVCNGISLLLFGLLYWIMDVRRQVKWAFFLKPAGENSLTTYIAPDIIYYLIWITGAPVLFYKHSDIPLVVIAGSIVWALAMVGLTALLVKLGIKLRL
jgi:heparan-alpha-glucosaminide N-acetyltransferase